MKQNYVKSSSVQQQQTMLAMGSNTLMPYGHKRAQAAYATQSATLLRSSNHSYNGAFQVSSYDIQGILG